MTIHGLNFKGSVPHFLEATGNQVLLDIKPSFEVSEVYLRLENFGAEGRELYKHRILTTDVILPISLFWFLILFMSIASEKFAFRKAVKWTLLAMPIGFLIFDFAENISIYVLISSLPEQMNLLATVLPYFTVIKRITVLCSLFLPIGLFLYSKYRSSRT